MKSAFNRHRELPAGLTVTAAQWALRQERGDLSLADERELAAWIATDPAHLAAYEDALWALVSVAQHAAAPEIIELRNAALSTRGQRRRFWGVVSGGALAASLAIGFWFSWAESPSTGQSTPAIMAMDPRTAIYQTRVGERSTMTLPDGSVVTLDTNSRVQVAYGARERGIRLLQGQAMFEVAHDKSLPFNVYAQGQRITAVGTVFNVRIEKAGMRVAMVEGTVRVQRQAIARTDGPSRTIQPAVTLTAGEGLVADKINSMVVEQVDARQVSSWIGGMLTFNDTPLASAVAEINRYTLKPIRIQDSRAGSHRISGVFKSNDSEHFAHAMTEFLPVEIGKESDGVIILHSKSN